MLTCSLFVLSFAAFSLLYSVAHCVTAQMYISMRDALRLPIAPCVLAFTIRGPDTTPRSFMRLDPLEVIPWTDLDELVAQHLAHESLDTIYNKFSHHVYEENVDEISTEAEVHTFSHGSCLTLVGNTLRQQGLKPSFVAHAAVTVCGRPDYILCNKENRKPKAKLAIEYKTLSAPKFTTQTTSADFQAARADRPRMTPLQHHLRHSIRQLWGYMAVSEFPYPMFSH
jgi:hypothetical protein